MTSAHVVKPGLINPTWEIEMEEWHIRAGNVFYVLIFAACGSVIMLVFLLPK